MKFDALRGWNVYTNRELLSSIATTKKPTPTTEARRHGEEANKSQNHSPQRTQRTQRKSENRRTAETLRRGGNQNKEITEKDMAQIHELENGMRSTVISSALSPYYYSLKSRGYFNCRLFSILW